VESQNHHHHHHHHHQLLRPKLRTDEVQYPRPESQRLEQVLAQDPQALDGRTQRQGVRPQVCPGTVEAESAEQKCDTDSEHTTTVGEHADHTERCPRSHK
jgi:hypothetical protein